MTTPLIAPAGLKNVIVTDTAIGDVRGEEGYFHYRGHDATRLAAEVSFEDAWHLVLFGALPGPSDGAAFTHRVGELRPLPGGVLDLLRAVVGPDTEPMHALRVALAALGLGDRPLMDLPEDERTEAALRYAAVTPTILAAAHRLARGEAPLQQAVDAVPAQAVRVGIGGQGEELDSSIRSLLFAFALAVFLVYLVMASQFESLLHPFVILFTIVVTAIYVMRANSEYDDLTERVKREALK